MASGDTVSDPLVQDDAYFEAEEIYRRHLVRNYSCLYSFADSNVEMDRVWRPDEAYEGAPN